MHHGGRSWTLAERETASHASLNVVIFLSLGHSHESDLCPLEAALIFRNDSKYRCDKAIHAEVAPQPSLLSD